MNQPNLTEYALITMQPGAIGDADNNLYGTALDPAKLEEVGKLLSAGASPPMTFMVLPMQPAKWDSL